MAKGMDKTALKLTLRDAMLALEAAERDLAETRQEALQESAMLDDRDNPDKEDIAAARINADQAAAMDHPVQVHEAKIDALENMDFSVTDTVRLGAIVTVDQRHYVAAVATSGFEFDGKTYLGISEGSPIFRAMEGLKAGETFELNGKTHKVQAVF